MSLVDRCDEITRLIDDVLREIPAPDSADESGVDAHPVAREEDDSAAQDGEATGPIHATDGMWRQRPVAATPGEAPDVAA